MRFQGCGAMYSPPPFAKDVLQTFVYPVGETRVFLQNGLVTGIATKWNCIRCKGSRQHQRRIPHRGIPFC